MQNSIQNATQQNIAAEYNKYEAQKTWVNVYKVSYDNSGRKTKTNWFMGLVTQVTNRGLIVNPFDPEPAGENTDVLSGSFVPFTMFNPSIEIQIANRRD